jgi:hypothetical protein
MPLTSNSSILQGRSPAELRNELEQLVVNDLLGPTGGPFEEVDEAQIEERYLVGKLAPRDVVVPQEQSDELAVADDDAGEDGSAEPSTVQGESLYPSAIGLSFTLDAEAHELRITANWGRYKCEKSEDIRTEKDNPKTVWRRYPISGQLDLKLSEGAVAATTLNPQEPDVVVRGRMRRNTHGLWYVSLFLVNNQTYQKGEGLRGEHWVFQPELIVEAVDKRPIFVRRRVASRGEHLSEARLIEERALNMLYRGEVELAVGHSVAVDWILAQDDPQRAVRLRTRIVPTYEVCQVSTATAEDNSDLAGLVLDMKELAEMDPGALVSNLARLPDAYRRWIGAAQIRAQQPRRIFRSMPRSELTPMTGPGSSGSCVTVPARRSPWSGLRPSMRTG